MQKVTQRLIVGQKSYIVPVIKNGFVLSSHLSVNPETYLLTKVLDAKVKSFVEVTRNDKILSTYGTKNQVNKLKKYYQL